MTGSLGLNAAVKQPAYLVGLNDEQKKAVLHKDGPLLVFAGAGSGKTRVLTSRIAHLIHGHGVSPSQILALTFTNKAAGEMRERVGRFLGSEPEGMWVGTFHSFGVSILRRHAEELGWNRHFTIFDADDSLRLVRRTVEMSGLPIKEFNANAVRAEISSAKNSLETPQMYLDKPTPHYRRNFRQGVARLYEEYDLQLKRQNAFDFDDLLLKPVQLLERFPEIAFQLGRRYRYILVDEYQDTNIAQYRMLELLARESRNLMVVGDPDQSIYSWRGADIRNILEFEQDFKGAEVIKLEQNYRSCANILNAANHVIRNNKGRKEKNLWTRGEEGEKLRIVSLPTDRDEAAWIADEIRHMVALNGETEYGDVAVLYRTNAQSRLLEEAFKQARIPYEVVGGFSFYERREIRDLLAYLRLIVNPADESAFQRTVNIPRRGIGEKSLARLLSYAYSNGITALEAARRADDISDLTNAPREALKGFADLIDRCTRVAETGSLGALLEYLITEIDLFAALEAEGPEGEDRVDNVRELIRSAEEYSFFTKADEQSVLERFIQDATLMPEVEEGQGQGVVTLTSLHAAKGLEYPIVFLSGLEDGLFPHDRSADTWEGIEEERRLFYVGITRAKQQLILTHAVLRRRGGDMLPASPSMFLAELPDHVLEGGRGKPAAGEKKNTQRKAAPATIAFEAGQRVAHPTLGNGVVAEVIGNGPALQLLVDFDKVGRRRVLARFSGIQPT